MLPNIGPVSVDLIDRNIREIHKPFFELIACRRRRRRRIFSEWRAGMNRINLDFHDAQRAIYPVLRSPRRRALKSAYLFR